MNISKHIKSKPKPRCLQLLSLGLISFSLLAFYLTVSFLAKNKYQHYPSLRSKQLSIDSIDRVNSHQVSNISVNTAVRSTMRPVTEVVRSTIRPVTEVVRSTIRPATEVATSTIRPVTEVVRSTIRPVTEVVRSTIRPVTAANTGQTNDKPLLTYAQKEPSVLVIGGTDGSGTRRVVDLLCQLGVSIISEGNTN